MEIKATFISYVSRGDERYPVCEFKYKGKRKQIISNIPDRKTEFEKGTPVVLSVDKHSIKNYAITDKFLTKKHTLLVCTAIAAIIILCIIVRTYGVTIY